MSGHIAIVSAARRLSAEGRAFSVATVVCVEGSSYRKPGARMLVCDDHWIAGSVSGGCLEHDLVRKAWWLAREGEARLVTYDSTGDDDVAWALGCQGIVHVLVEAAGAPSDPIEFIARCIDDQSRGVIATVFRSDSPKLRPGARLFVRCDQPIRSHGVDGEPRALIERLCLDPSLLRSRVATVGVEGGSADVLVEVVTPPPRLFLFGAGHDALPVARMGAELGWEVFVHDPAIRRAPQRGWPAAVTVCGDDLARVKARIDASDRALAVVMNHHLGRDAAALAMLLDSNASYIGALGPRSRAERLLGGMGRCDALGEPRFHAPVGLALEAETPEEVALSIIAEMQAITNSARATSLSGESGPIHGRVAA